MTASTSTSSIHVPFLLYIFVFLFLKRIIYLLDCFILKIIYTVCVNISAVPTKARLLIPGVGVRGCSELPDLGVRTEQGSPHQLRMLLPAELHRASPAPSAFLAYHTSLCFGQRNCSAC